MLDNAIKELVFGGAYSVRPRLRTTYTSNITVERKNSMNGCCLILKSPLRLAHRWRIHWNARLLSKVSLTLYYSKKSHERE
ncbi:hypothetical protein J2793_005414 [Paraburkholderia caledonica]|uniref:Uncharacterized protein n=1 Tax=Paraburkholderia caledonica TaxID=134536 RepID=A0AB73IJS6_9BURK|nr:hypothetical protein [Paraburkholderia caledonica]